MTALDGLRVVDLSRVRTGAQATQVLADFGADVVWIEPPGGSPLRQARAFPLYGRGKQSLVLDLADPAQQQTAADLAADADVVVECFRPGVAERLGLGYDTLACRSPQLVYASISGFGTRSPYAHVQGYEGLVQAKLGVFKAFERMSTTTHPPFVTVPWCSFAASQAALHGILAALVEREHSGLGQRVETNLVQAFMALDTWEWFLDLVTQRYPEAFSHADAYSEGVPMSPLVYMLLVGLTSDGRWMQFAQVAPRLYVALMKALGLDWMFTDPEWHGIPLFPDAERRGALLDRMHEAAAQRTLAEWEAVFESDPDVFAEIYRSGPEVLDHPQLRHGGHVVTIDDHERGAVRQPGPFADAEATPAVIGAPAPGIGEHRDLAVRSSRRAARPRGDARRMPLEGVTVVEMAVMYAAPYGATLLTDLGARVIKIEPLGGDPIRNLMPFPESGGAKVMQGKDSICVDITTDEGRAIVHQLAARADLVLEGFRSGVADRLGLGPATLHAINPDLVYVSASGYGHGGPDGHRPAFAPSIGAASGIARANIGDTLSEAPGLSTAEIRTGSIRLFSASAVVQAQADGFAALAVASALLIGLLARERGAGGQWISSSMLSTNAHAMADHVVDHDDAPTAIGPGADMRGPHACYRIYDASTGWVFLAAPSQRDWDALASALVSSVDLAGDPRFTTDALRLEHDGALTDVLARVFSKRSNDEWEQHLLASGVGCVAVTTQKIERVLQGDEFGRAGDYIVDVTHPTFDEHARIAPLVQFSRSATQAKPGVLAGCSTDLVLCELGYDDDAIADLRARAIVG